MGSDASDGESGEFIHTNAGELETKGVEVALNNQPTPRLFLSAYATYMDAAFSKFPRGPCYLGQAAGEGCDPITGSQDLSGASLSNAPNWTLNLTTQFTFEPRDVPFDGFVRGSYYWRDAVIFNLDQDPGSRQDSYGICNLALGILSASIPLRGFLK